MDGQTVSWPELAQRTIPNQEYDLGNAAPQYTQQRDLNIAHERQDFAPYPTSQPNGEDPHLTSNMGGSFMSYDAAMPVMSNYCNTDWLTGEPVRATNTNPSSPLYENDLISQAHFNPWTASSAPALPYQQPQYLPQPGDHVPEELRTHQQPLYGMSGSGFGLGISLPPTSHPVGAIHHGGFVDDDSPVRSMPGFAPDVHNQWHPARPPTSMPQDNIFGNDDDEAGILHDGPDGPDPCYAQLLYRCLKDAPNYTLSLKELYDWVACHSSKAKDHKNRGWQNSVRHNLSMNAAFERVPHGVHAGPKKGSLWRLTPAALRDGVISTTRYRKDPKRRAQRSAAPALNRQRSGAKGGQATREASRRRNELNRYGHRERRQYYENGSSSAPYSPASSQLSPHPSIFPANPPPSPYFTSVDTSQAASPKTPAHCAFSFDDPAAPAPYLTSDFEFAPLHFCSSGNELIAGTHGFDMASSTPSLATEASFMDDDVSPLLLDGSRTELSGLV